VLQAPPGATYCLSQRAAHIWDVASPAGAGSRAVIGTGDKVPGWAHLPSDYPIVRIPLSEQPAPMRHILAAVRAGSSYQPAIAAELDSLREIAAGKREHAAPDSETLGYPIREP
jgi:hypothetical protein